MGVKRTDMSKNNQSAKDENISTIKDNVQKAKSSHEQFIASAYARIRDIGTERFVSSPVTITNTGGYIQISRKKA